MSTTEKSHNFLRENILEFMSVIEVCLKSTNYAEDRTPYMKDIANAASWLIKLHKGTPPIDVAREIIDPQTDKLFLDYLKEGEWGEHEVRIQNLIIPGYIIRSIPYNPLGSTNINTTKNVSFCPKTTNFGYMFVVVMKSNYSVASDNNICS